MTKAKTKGAKKRGRPAHEGAEREPSGRISRNPASTRARKEEAMRPAIEARARAMGLFPQIAHRMQGETAEEHQARLAAREGVIRALAPLARREWMGCAVGQAIAEEEHVLNLWAAVKLIRDRRAGYLRAIAAPQEQAKSANLMVAPSSEETLVEARGMAGEPLSEEDAARRSVVLWEELRDVILGHHPLAVRFTIDRICAEVPGSDTAPVPKAPVIAILKHVHTSLIGPLENA